MEPRPAGHQAFLSTLPAERGERRLALAVVLASAAIFLAAVPFARVPLAPVVAFIPVYQSALAVLDLITAVLLFGQVRFLGSRALCVLASGYLFTACMAVAHMLTFPGLFSPTGLLGAGPQTTAWLYMLWHAGFPLSVIGYARLQAQERETAPASGRGPIAAAVGVVLLVTWGVTLLVTAGQGILPAIMRGNRYAPAMLVVVSATWALSLVALVALWRRRPRVVLDLWLMVVLCAWLFDVALAAVLNQGRFDLGFYAGRVYGLLAATFVLVVLLLEYGRLYGRLVAAHAELARQNASLEETVRERTERLLQSEKVATMGSLLAGVAHELNNPLAILIGQAELLEEEATAPELRGRARRMLAAAERCVRIVRNFLSLARRRAPEQGEVRLNQVVQEALELLAYELRTGGVGVTLELAADLPVLWGDPHQLHQVIVNLVANAHQAMRPLRTPRHLTLVTRHADGVASLTITDTGPGIPAEIQAKLFEPFFTTKPLGEGTGLGLSLCRSIVESHGGTVTVASEPGHGATFTVALPIRPRPAAAATPAPAEAARPAEPRAILVVDDETEIAATLAEALQREGHRVDVCHDGRDGLDHLARQRYDLVFTDTRMPGMDGIAFYEEAVRRFPDLRRRFVFVTGDVIDHDKRAVIEASGCLALEKPFDLALVRLAIRQAFTGGGWLSAHGRTPAHPPRGDAPPRP